MLLAASLMFLVGCEPEVGDGPPDLKLGQDLCIHCNMIITDQRYAAASIAIVDGKKRVLAFDDTGDLLDYHRANPQIEVIKRYVGDASTRAWIEFERAHFVHAPTVHTPMGSGILAYASEADAQAASEKHEGRRVNATEIGAVRANLGSATESCCGTKAGG
jgi:copper chaperone NosL